jgi:ankyrin repeat protein
VYTVRVRLVLPPHDELCNAVENGDTQAVSALAVDTLPPQGVDDVRCDILTPLELAAALGKSSVIKMLILSGANPNTWRPLALAVTEGQRDAVNMLLDMGGDPNAAAPDGSTALMYAASVCRGDLVDVLVDNGADIDRTMSGWNAHAYWDAECTPKPFRWFTGSTEGHSRYVNRPPSLFPLPYV